MAKVFRTSNRESSILSKIESSKEHARRMALKGIVDCIDPLSNAIATKLVETKLVETTSKNSLEEQINNCLDKLQRADDFDIAYQVAPLRELIHHKDTVDIFGSDEEIYLCIHQQVKKYLP